MNNKLTPFKLFALKNFPFIEADFDAITNYELLCKIVEYLNNVINSQNEVITNFNNLYNSFVELKEYVDHYFDTLDLQEEVNNKLDEMVESGEFETLINNYFNPNVKIIVPKNFTGVDAGDITLLKVYDKNIVIDTHRVDALGQVTDFLDRNNISNIDYLILTHYHDDHVGNVISLISEGYIDENTHVYLPAYSPLIEDSESTKELYTNINNTLVADNIPYEVPSEGDTLEIEDFKLTFYNCETSIFQTMGVTNYNDCSTVCLCEYGDEKVLFTGDIIDKPFKRFIDNQMFNFKINLYKIEHHGNDINSLCVPFLQQIIPDVSIQETTSYSISLGRTSRGSSLAFMMMKNIPIYSQYDNTDDIIFDIFKDRYALVQGKQTSLGNQDCIKNTYYVNPSSTNTVQNGSQTYPFVNLHQCLAKIDKMPYSNNEINLANGTYEGLTNIRINNAYIVFKGNNVDNVIIKDLMYVLNSNVSFEKITFDISSTNGVDLTDCIASFNNCKFKNVVEDAVTSQVGLTSLSSMVHCRNCVFENGINGINCQYGLMEISDSTIQKCTSGIRANRSIYNYVNTTFTSNTNNLYDTESNNLSDNVKIGTLLSDSDVEASVNNTISLSKSIKNYKLLIISTGFLNNGTWETTVVHCRQNIEFALNNTFTINTSTGSITLEVTANQTLTITAVTGSPSNIRQVYGINI